MLFIHNHQIISPQIPTNTLQCFRISPSQPQCLHSIHMIIVHSPFHHARPEAISYFAKPRCIIIITVRSQCHKSHDLITITLFILKADSMHRSTSVEYQSNSEQPTHFSIHSEILLPSLLSHWTFSHI
jgi:hypothetical protein